MIGDWLRINQPDGTTLMTRLKGVRFVRASEHGEPADEALAVYFHWSFGKGQQAFIRRDDLPVILELVAESQD